MARSGGKRGVMEHHCLNRFRRRRLLAFLRRNNLPSTFDALKHETSVFFDVRFLRRQVAAGRWQEAREYFSRFLPCLDEVEAHAAPTALRFITRLNVLDDLAQGKLGCIDTADDLQTQLDAFPSNMIEADPHYAAAVCAVLYNGSHPAYCLWMFLPRTDPVDWQLIRLKAAQVVKDLVTRSPEFRHLLRLPRCPSHPCYTIPFGFGGCRRHKRKKNIGRMSASLLARRFLQKERRHSSPCYDQGLSCEPMDLDEIIDETLLAGKQEVKEHSDSCSEGVPGSPVELFISKSFGTAPPNTVTKRLSQECSAESSNGAKLKPTTGQFGPVDADHVLDKVQDLGDISNDMAMLVKKICTHGGPDHKMFVKKFLEQEKLLFELQLDCLSAMIRGCTSPWNPDHVLDKVQDLGDISNDMAMLVKKICTHGGPDHKMFVKKFLEQEKLLFQLRLDCLSAMIRGRTSPWATRNS